LIKEHVHNTYMYALISAGFAGTAAFVGGLAWAWIIFLRSMRRGIADRYGQRAFLIQAGGILAFFTVRSIPEVCGAMFGVDFMVMLPALAYLTILDQKGKEEAAPAAAE
jgi:O-antigen ligase